MTTCARTQHERELVQHMSACLAERYPCEREVATDVVAILILLIRPLGAPILRPPGHRDREQRVNAIASSILMEGIAQMCGDEFHNGMLEACLLGHISER